MTWLQKSVEINDMQPAWFNITLTVCPNAGSVRPKLRNKLILVPGFGQEHLSDPKCNAFAEIFASYAKVGRNQEHGTTHVLQRFADSKTARVKTAVPEWALAEGKLWQPVARQTSWFTTYN